jgi:hypothetical protein
MDTRVVVVIVDGLPLDLAEEVAPRLPFLGSRLRIARRGDRGVPHLARLRGYVGFARP